LNVSEWASLVNAVTVVILVIINAYYLKIAKAQVEAANAQARESQRPAGAATENLKLSQAQVQQQAAHELTTVLSLLHGVIADVAFWTPIVKERWNTAPATVRLVPDDSPGRLSCWPGLNGASRQSSCRPHYARSR
jgi:hypothetical protein